MLLENFTVNSPNVVYTPETITSEYDYKTTKVERKEDGQFVIRPTSVNYSFKTQRTVPKMG